MKIAHIISTFPPYRGGMGNSVFHSVLEVGNLGYDNAVFTPAYDNEHAREEQLAPGVRLIRFKPWLSIGNGAVLPQVMSRLGKFDVIHLHYPFYGTAELVLAVLSIRRAFLLRRPKLVLHYHMDTFATGLKGLIFKMSKWFCLPLIVRLSDVITCASFDYIKHSDLGVYFEAHKEKFVQVPFGVDTARFHPAQKAVSQTILFVGGLNRAHYFKGVSELIHAFALVVKDFPDARLVLVGSGDMEKTYTEEAQALGLSERFEIRNSISNQKDTDALPQQYREALVSVLPSINSSEAFGLVLLEAMACGTPVIASNLPGVRSVFKNNTHGYLVQPGDIEDLAKKLAWFLAHRETAADMGKAGRDWVVSQYSWTKVARELDAVYCRVTYTPDVPEGTVSDAS